MASTDLETYFRSQQVPLQWLPILQAIGAELPTHTDARELRELLFRIGTRFAGGSETLFQAAQSLPQLEESLNDFWTRIQWGWVALSEDDSFIRVEHHAAPLAEAFGDDALPWSVGLLEGFYETVFRTLGAGASMVIRKGDTQTHGMGIHLHFGREDS